MADSLIGEASAFTGAPKTRATLAAAAYSELREVIMFGDLLPPGAPLRLEELGRMLGMSISPVREAVRLLEAQGLAEYAPYKGARVTGLSATEMAEIYEARTALERVSMRRAAERFTKPDAVRLNVILRQIREAYDTNDRVAMVRGNSAFHAAIAEIAASSWLQRLLSPVLETSERYAAAVLRTGRTTETAEVEERGHKAIVDALQSNDAQLAEEVLDEHLNGFSRIFAGELADELTEQAV